MGQFFNIINGWENYIFKDKNVELLAKDRAKQCESCEFAVKKKFLTFVKDDFKEVEGFVCGKCICPLSAKVRSVNEKCPIGLW